MDYQVYSVLVKEGKPVGVRFRAGVSHVDVDIKRLKGLSKNMLNGVKREKVFFHGGSWVTQSEVDNQFFIQDKSDDAEFCKHLMKSVFGV